MLYKTLGKILMLYSLIFSVLVSVRVAKCSSDFAVDLVCVANLLLRDAT
jgi:hypothetical protein